MDYEGLRDGSLVDRAGHRDRTITFRGRLLRTWRTSTRRVVRACRHAARVADDRAAGRPNSCRTRHAGGNGDHMRVRIRWRQASARWPRDGVPAIAFIKNIRNFAARAANRWTACASRRSRKHDTSCRRPHEAQNVGKRKRHRLGGRRRSPKAWRRSCPIDSAVEGLRARGGRRRGPAYRSS